MAFRELSEFRFRGHADDIASATVYASLGNTGGNLLLDYPAAGAEIAIASTDNTDDIAAGDGARSVRVWGTTEEGVEIFEDFTLNGQTKVEGSLLFYRLNAVEVLGSGVDGRNAGGIWVGKATDTFTTGVPTNKYNFVAPALTLGSCGIYTVPAGRRIVFRKLAITAFGSVAGKVLSTRLECRKKNSNTWAVAYEHHVSDNGYPINELLIADPGMDLRLLAISTASPGSMSVTMIGEIEKETYQRT